MVVEVGRPTSFRFPAELSGRLEAAAAELNRRGQDASHVNDLGLAGQPDPMVFDAAVAQARIVVTENVADYATLLNQRLRNDEPCVPVVFVAKRDFPRRGALAAHL